jgi:hypothetical protein
MLMLGTVPHPQKLFVTFFMFQCGYFQVYTKFSFAMLLQFEVTDGALKHSGQKTYIRKHSMIQSGQILLEWEGHTSLHHQQPPLTCTYGAYLYFSSITFLSHSLDFFFSNKSAFCDIVALRLPL